MGIRTLIIIVSLSGMVPVMAGELISEPHALVYYQFAFSGNAPDTRSHFGMRLDRTFRESDQVLDFRDVVARPALAELRFDARGMESLSFAGVDYLAQYRTLKAAEGEATAAESAAPAEKPAEPAAAEKPAEAAKPAEKTADKAKTQEKEVLTMDKVMHSIPTGYFIGAGILALLLVEGATK